MKIHLAKNFVYEEARQRKDEIFMEMLARDGVPKKKGLMELLSYLEEKKIPAAVATSTRQSRGEKVLQMSGIAEYFAALSMETRKKQVNPNRIFSGMQQKRSDVIRRSVW